MKKRIQIALCDDEKTIHDIVEKQIEEYGRKRECNVQLLHFFSAKELLDSEEKFQILLLDIDMPQMDGIEAAKRLPEAGTECKIIMLTAKTERFKDAFKIGAYRFVTKPIEQAEFEEALDDTMEVLLGLEEVEIKTGNLVSRVSQCRIHYLKACGDYVQIFIGEKSYQNERTLKSWKDELDDRLFIECHKSYLVNLKEVKEMKQNVLLLENGKEIPVARRRKKEVLQAFIEFDVKR